MDSAVDIHGIVNGTFELRTDRTNLMKAEHTAEQDAITLGYVHIIRPRHQTNHLSFRWLLCTTFNLFAK